MGCTGGYQETPDTPDEPDVLDGIDVVEGLGRWFGVGLSGAANWIQVLDFLKKEYSAMHSFIVVAVGSQHRD